MDNTKKTSEGRSIPAVSVVHVSYGQMATAIKPASLLKTRIQQAMLSALAHLEDSGNLRQVRQITLICDDRECNSFQELSDSLKPGWHPPETPTNQGAE